MCKNNRNGQLDESITFSKEEKTMNKNLVNQINRLQYINMLFLQRLEKY